MCVTDAVCHLAPVSSSLILFHKSMDEDVKTTDPPQTNKNYTAVIVNILGENLKVVRSTHNIDGEKKPVYVDNLQCGVCFYRIQTK